jgi:hypothetical protein
MNAATAEKAITTDNQRNDPRFHARSPVTAAPVAFTAPTAMPMPSTSFHRQSI